MTLNSSNIKRQNDHHHDQMVEVKPLQVGTTREEDSSNKNDDNNHIKVERHQLIHEQQLTKLERWNVSCLILAFACTIASLILIVGSGALIIEAIPNGSTELTPFALGVFFIGMSFVSLLCSHWMFDKWGRKYGFLFGMCIGIFGSIIGIIGLLIFESTILVILSNLFLGGGCGIGMHIRFAAIEVVPIHYKSKTITYVLSGGCIAAFIGPETAFALQSSSSSTNDNDDDHRRYAGVFIAAAIFFLLQGFFVSLTKFQTNNNEQQKDNNQDKQENLKNNDKNNSSLNTSNYNTFPNTFGSDDATPDNLNTTHGDNTSAAPVASPSTTTTADITNSTTTTNTKINFNILKSILCSKQFLCTMIVATLCWGIMAMPMSIFRVTMNSIGYTERQSLTVLEFHFLGMYSPGICISGYIISKYGPTMGCIVALSLFIIATICNCFVQEMDGFYNNTTTNNNNNNNNILPNIGLWYIGFIALGCGWNFGFSSATVWVTECYKDIPQLKSQVQAANEFGMFLLSGMMICCTGYLYEIGTNINTNDGSPLNGWRFLNYTVITGLIVILTIVLLISHVTTRNNITNNNYYDSVQVDNKTTATTTTTIDNNNNKYYENNDIEICETKG